ncbi:hypothetical protein LWI29_031538 [Acer saccharum]|uniref:Protein FAR1-RELATED SEQUENCE n=1 Tax=Acer saccharum TaxID=4024 RepID=A0AA39RZD3_ACESA|nr:hypothetical protein LWI29_031538 [Acer saccharum]
MELDLELPSYEQEKLETGSIADDDVMDDTDMIQVEDEDVNSPTTSEPVEEGCRPIACNTITGSGDQVDVNMVGANVVHKGVTCEPKNGLEFESKEAAYSFYREYARSVGFGITIKASRRSKKSGKFIDVKIACSRFGSKRESSTTTNPRSCPKTGCKAGMHMKKRQDEKWVIYSFVKEHNHDICPDDFCHAIRGRNKQSGVLACQKKHLQLVLDDGDLEVMLEHFMCMKDENPNFFYAIDLDNEKCLRNVFWVDAKGRHDYSNFYDVVFFDTFYVKNKYKIPCVPIIGVNHHFQFILLGCALIGDENASSFVWLMRTWLKAVSGQAPKVIITDQDKILNEAVADVFPNTRHCFCLWQNTFLAGMSTPERSGSITSFFDKYMSRDATFKEFIDSYKTFLLDRYEMEAEADSETQNKQPGLRSLSEFEKQMSTIYTDTIFKKFQVEILGAVSCHLQKESEDGTTVVFRVDDFEERQNFNVAWNEAELDICCLCHSFEYRGFLCKHAILVLQMSGFSNIPPHYIMKRWTKDAKIGQTVTETSSRLPYRVQRFNDICKRAIRLGEEGSLSQEAYHIALQALEEALKHCMGMNSSVRGVLEANTLSAQGFLGIEEENCANSKAKSSKKKKMYKKRKVNSEPERTVMGLQDSCQQMEQMHSRAHTLTNSYVTQQNRQEMEASRAPILDSYYAYQQNLQGVGQLDSISPIRDVYYANQQDMQGLGQLHSMSAARVGHYGTQQSMQGLGQLGFRGPVTQGCFNIQESLQDMDHSAVSAQFNSITSKHLHEKHLSR